MSEEYTITVEQFRDLPAYVQAALVAAGLVDESWMSDNPLTPDWIESLQAAGGLGWAAGLFGVGLYPTYAASMMTWAYRAGYIPGAPESFTYLGRMNMAQASADYYSKQLERTAYAKSYLTGWEFQERMDYLQMQQGLYEARAAYWGQQQQLAPARMAWGGLRLLSYFTPELGLMRAFGFAFVGAGLRIAAIETMLPGVQEALAASPEAAMQKIQTQSSFWPYQIQPFFGQPVSPTPWGAAVGFAFGGSFGPSVLEWTLGQVAFWGVKGGFASMLAGEGFRTGAMATLRKVAGFSLAQPGLAFLAEGLVDVYSAWRLGVPLTAEQQMQVNLKIGGGAGFTLAGIAAQIYFRQPPSPIRGAWGPISWEGMGYTESGGVVGEWGPRTWAGVVAEPRLALTYRGLGISMLAGTAGYFAGEFAFSELAKRAPLATGFPFQPSSPWQRYGIPTPTEPPSMADIRLAGAMGAWATAGFVNAGVEALILRAFPQQALQYGLAQYGGGGLGVGAIDLPIIAGMTAVMFGEAYQTQERLRVAGLVPGRDYMSPLAGYSWTARYGGQPQPGFPTQLPMDTVRTILQQGPMSTFPLAGDFPFQPQAPWQRYGYVQPTNDPLYAGLEANRIEWNQDYWRRVQRTGLTPWQSPELFDPTRSGMGLGAQGWFYNRVPPSLQRASEFWSTWDQQYANFKAFQAQYKAHAISYDTYHAMVMDFIARVSIMRVASLQTNLGQAAAALAGISIDWSTGIGTYVDSWTGTAVTININAPMGSSQVTPEEWNWRTAMTPSFGLHYGAEWEKYRQWMRATPTRLGMPLTTQDIRSIISSEAIRLTGGTFLTSPATSPIGYLGPYLPLSPEMQQYSLDYLLGLVSGLPSTIPSLPSGRPWVGISSPGFQATLRQVGGVWRVGQFGAFQNYGFWEWDPLANGGKGGWKYVSHPPVTFPLIPAGTIISPPPITGEVLTPQQAARIKANRYQLEMTIGDPYRRHEGLDPKRIKERMRGPPDSDRYVRVVLNEVLGEGAAPATSQLANVVAKRLLGES